MKISLPRLFAVDSAAAKAMTLTIAGVPMYFLHVGTIVTIIYIHLSTVLQYSFTKKQKIGYSIKNAFKVGFGKIKHFLLPYSYAIVVYFIGLQVFWFIPEEPRIITFVSVLLATLMISWFRLYASKILSKLHKVFIYKINKKQKRGEICIKRGRR